ncbi:glycine C-acetyltransferase [Patescibacteria group bacterium]|nr:glycine C-acetyltransferase [Patescibacteria group bacterium]MBU2036524.1 glycine C-acetyltransferase [Patescibacteria group bacterium]
MNNKLDWIDKDISELKEKGLFKNIKTIESAIDAEIMIDGKKLLNFCSNNYLGFANKESLKEKAKEAIDKYGVGPAAVRTISGTLDLHIKLEEELAKFKKVDAAILFQSGLCANLATIPVLVGPEDVIFSDELNHASIIDGCRLSKAKVIVYKHLNPKDLEEKIKENLSFERKLVITDGVFSMDGDIAPLDELYKVSEKYDCMLMVDDAHGEGVLGESGRGIVDHFKLHGKVDVEVGTLSKAFGVVGGFVAGKGEVVEILRQKARPFLFSSAMTPADTQACIEAIKTLEKSDKPVKKLWNNAKYFKEKMDKLGFDTGNSKTPITPVMLGDAKLANEFSKKLFEEGVFAVAIGYPTVPMGKARIRVMLSAAHTKAHLDKALEKFAKVGKELGVIF